MDEGGYESFVSKCIENGPSPETRSRVQYVSQKNAPNSRILICPMNKNPNKNPQQPTPYSNKAEHTMRGAIAVIKDGDRFLAIKRSQTVRAPGKICFPGGGVEPGETVEEALVREMQEELGVAVTPIKYVWRCTSVGGFDLSWWVTEVEPGEVITPDHSEVESYHWMTQAELVADRDLLESNLNFFDALDRGEFAL